MGTSSNKSQKDKQPAQDQIKEPDIKADPQAQQKQPNNNNQQEQKTQPNDKQNQPNNNQEQLPSTPSLQTSSQSTRKFPFNPNQSVFQANQTERLVTSYNTSGNCITIGFGGSLQVFDSFFQSLYTDHNLDGEPLYNYSKFFSESSNGFETVYTPRGFAYDIPSEQMDILQSSVLSSSYRSQSISFRDQTDDEKDGFIKAFFDEEKAKEINEQLRMEVEKCDKLHQLHFISDLFNGSAMGLLTSFLYEIQNDFKSTLKIAHLKYNDSFAHRAFSKRKNYIFSVSKLYNKCTMINLLNAPRAGEVINNLTLGDRINEYSSRYSMNKIISGILIDPNANFVYSNGTEILKDTIKESVKFVFVDCKEGKSHISYFTQNSSLCIYKGMNLINESVRRLFERELSMIVNKKLNSNKGFYSFLEIEKPFEIDFASHIHHSNIFKEMTEEYFLDFLQDYNLRHFTPREREMRDETIWEINDVLNYYKEVWKFLK